ncbi:MAG: hypothetical protein PHY47_09675 [Lachnospiraceae bacterium]|nr:hypothetical protein [Lachnospiraceae bacterium]
MAKQSKDEKINHLEKLVAMYQENCEQLGKRNAELVDAEEDTFMHSPTYLQMKEKIIFLENINKLNDMHVASIKKSSLVVEDDVRQIYEDNKKLTSEKADIEYFVGITENWRDAMEYEKLKKEICELQGKIEQKNLSIQDRDAEIENLQERLAQKEAADQEAKRKEEQQESISAVPMFRRGGR